MNNIDTTSTFLSSGSQSLEIYEEKDHAWTQIDGTYFYSKDAASLIKLLEDMKKNFGNRSSRS